MTAAICHFQVGSFACFAVLDGTGRYPPGTFFTNLRKDQFEPALRERGQSPEEMEVPYISLLIQAGRENVLVDTGLGRRAPTTGKLLAHLRSEGIEPRDIETVILSHAHPDHIGGNLNEAGKPAFPNARFVMLKQEWDFWTSNPSLAELRADQSMKELMLASVQENLRPIREQIDLVQPETEIVRGISAVAAFGHSPGQLALKISSEGRQFIFVADAIIDPIDVEYPHACGVTDHQPDTMVATRLRLLDQAAKESALVSASHFPFPGLGHVTRNGTRWKWRPAPAA